MHQCFKLSLFFLLIASQGQSKEINFELLKEEIYKKEQALCRSSSEAEKSRLFYELALAYEQDQDLEKAFQCFFQALQLCPKKEEAFLNPGEREIYEAAVKEYLDLQGIDPQGLAQKLMETYGEKTRPGYFHLNLLLGMASANLEDYRRFFTNFYESFPQLHDHFLAHKGLGILSLRLSQFAHTSFQKHAYKEGALQYLMAALERCPKDSNLYRLLITLAKEEKNEALHALLLQKIVENKVAIPRTDVYLHVRDAVALQEFHLAQEIIDLARSLYHYSRSLSAAEQYLKEHRG